MHPYLTGPGEPLRGPVAMTTPVRRVERRALQVSVRAKRLARAARPGWVVRRSRLGCFAIAHTARCGSTVLGDLLRQHPDIAYAGEVYGLHLTRLKGQGQDDSLPDVDLGRVVARELRVMRPGWAGIEYLSGDLRVTGTDVRKHADILRSLGFDHFVLLRRENLLRRYLSLEMARSSHRWHAHDTGTADVDSRAPIPLAVRDLGPGHPDLVSRFAALEQFYSDLRRIHRDEPLLELTYEHHIEADPRVAYEAVANFLGLSPFRPSVRVRRLNTRTVRDSVSNFDEVAEMLAPTRYAWMLDT